MSWTQKMLEEVEEIFQSRVANGTLQACHLKEDIYLGICEIAREKVLNERLEQEERLEEQQKDDVSEMQK